MSDSYGIYDSSDWRRFFPAGTTWRDWNWCRELVGTIVRKGEPGRVLDVGCGLGYVVELCRLWGIECEGIEGSQDAINEARDRGVGLIQYNLASTAPFPFPDMSFTTILLSEVVEHLSRPVAQRVLQECFRCLVLGGTLIIFTPSRYEKTQSREPDHINLYTPTGMKCEVEQQGFVFREYLNNWPRAVFTYSPLERLMWRQVCRFFHPDWLSAGAGLIADRPGKL